MTREEGKEVTLKRIRKAIARLLKTKGYENITIREICKEANISIGTFYNYYDSKDAIIEDTIKFGFYLSQEFVKPEVDPNHILDSLLEYIDKKVSFIDTLSVPMMTEIFRSFLYRNGSLLLDQSTADFQKMYYVVQFGQEEGQISTRLSAKEMTESIIKCVTGNCYMWCALNGDMEINEIVQKEMKALLMP